MAEALIGGVLEARLAEPQDVAVGEPVDARPDYLKAQYGLRAPPTTAAALHRPDSRCLAARRQAPPPRPPRPPARPPRPKAEHVTLHATNERRVRLQGLDVEQQIRHRPQDFQRTIVVGSFARHPEPVSDV